ncbi:legumain-like [Actinia tenebrosa]|uniref:legumain n=1 Tax=Actinia tenebrosa TaxID=6105 RepID=A0A6P8ICH8_ACTTE|nr:legumain-like [Actinia tenebrosa]
MACLNVLRLLAFTFLYVHLGYINEALATEGKHWALLVAGSNTWGNYRHQADICHAYQVLHKNGIPDENIVVMTYDDIAYNEQNPTPGTIINKVGGPNVYKGVVKDYTRKEVTPEKFLRILKGEKSLMREFGSGKVIDSGPDDHVFVYFSDHGAPGLVAFPEGELMANDLNDAIHYMHTNKKFKKMVFYIESCESGSMFNTLLPDNIKVYATTASTPNESSYACYFDKKLETYLGDVYSVKWLENSDSSNLRVETLLQQFKIVRRETNTSHVQKYGDMSFENEVLEDFLGGPEKVEQNVLQNQAKIIQPEFDAVPSPDVPIAILEHKLENAKDPETKKLIKDDLEKEIKMRLKIQDTVRQIAEHASQNNLQIQRVIEKAAVPRDYICYKKAIKAFKTFCFNFQEYEYALRHVYVLSNLCEEHVPVERITDAITSVCGTSA